MDSEEILTGCLTAIVVFFLALLINFAYAGIGVWLWGAIVVPVFGLPALGYWQMYGLILLINIMLPSRGYSGSKK